MPIDLRRELRVAVAHDPLHGRWIRSGHHQQARSRVPRGVKPDRSNLRLWPKLAPIHGTTPQRGVRRFIGVIAALPTAHMLVAGDNASPAHGAPQDRNEINILPHH
jgi:hypothetical protein